MIPVQRNWTPIKSGRFFQLYLDVMNRAKEVKLWPITKRFPKLYLQKASTKTMGVCYYCCKDGVYDFAIILNEVLLDCSDDVVRKILVHEVAHAIRPNECHGYYWFQAADIIGDKWGYKAERCVYDEEVTAAIEKLLAKRKMA